MPHFFWGAEADWLTSAMKPVGNVNNYEEKIAADSEFEAYVMTYRMITKANKGGEFVSVT